MASHAPLADPSGERAVPGETRTYSFFAVAGLLGQRTRSPAWLKRYLDALVAGMGFPPPLPTLAHGYPAGSPLVTSATVNSKWLRAAVDAWLDGTLPPSLAPAVAARETTATGSRLDARAEQLGLTVIAGGRA